MYCSLNLLKFLSTTMIHSKRMLLLRFSIFFLLFSLSNLVLISPFQRGSFIPEILLQQHSLRVELKPEKKSSKCPFLTIKTNTVLKGPGEASVRGRDFHHVDVHGYLERKGKVGSSFFF